MKSTFVLPLVLLGIALGMNCDVSAQRGRGGAGGGGGGESRDLLNLGAIGARGTVQDQTIRIDEVNDTGPAKELLQVGDVITGVAGNVFKADPRHDLGKAINTAEGKAGKGELSLSITRGGAEATVKITLPIIGSYSETYPQNCDKSDVILKNACEWLKRNSSGGHWNAQYSHNGVVAVTSMCGLALLAADPETYRPHITGVAKWLAGNCGKEQAMPGGGGANHSQVNWNLGFGGIFLGEYYLATKDDTVLPKIKEVADQIVKSQETSGGWAHGPGGPNALNYVELNVCAYLCLNALALAKECGTEINMDAVQRGQDYVESSTRGGAVGYSNRPGQLGMPEPGRAGGTLCAYKMFGNRPTVANGIQGFLARSYPKTPEGHASQIVQFTFSCMGCKAASDDTYRKFMDHFAWYLDLARCPDGGFISQPNNETLRMGRNFDRPLTRAWATGAYALCYAIGKGGLHMTGGRSKKADEPKVKRPITFRPPPKKKDDGSAPEVSGDKKDPHPGAVTQDDREPAPTVAKPDTPKPDAPKPDSSSSGTGDAPKVGAQPPKPDDKPKVDDKPKRKPPPPPKDDQPDWDKILRGE